MLSPDVLLPSAAAVEVEDGELMYLELQVTLTVVLAAAAYVCSTGVFFCAPAVCFLFLFFFSDSCVVRVRLAVLFPAAGATEGKAGGAFGNSAHAAPCAVKHSSRVRACSIYYVCTSLTYSPVLRLMMWGRSRAPACRPVICDWSDVFVVVYARKC